MTQGDQVVVLLLYIRFKEVMMRPNMNPTTENMPSVVRTSSFLIFMAIKVQMITVATIT